MARRRVWLVAAVLFTLVNLGSIPMALRAGEGNHAGVHVGLTILGAYAVWRLMRRSRETPAALEGPGDRLEYLQESVDAIALEVERIGEAQRFDAKLRQERGDPPG